MPMEKRWSQPYDSSRLGRHIASGPLLRHLHFVVSGIINEIPTGETAVRGWSCLETVLVLSQANLTHLVHRRTHLDQGPRPRWILRRVPLPCRLRRSWGLRTRSRTPRPTKAPLAPVEPKEMAVSLACCVLLRRLRMRHFPMLSGSCFSLLIMSCVGCYLNVLICSIQSDSRNGTTSSL